VTGLLRDIPSARRRVIIYRECAIAFCVLLTFMFFGRTFLEVMKLSEEAMAIAGGVILFLVALKMIFKEPDAVREDEAPAQEPFIVPVAVPLIAGPSALATVMLMASREPAKLWVWIAALTAVMLVTTTLLALSSKIERFLGRRSVEAIERLMGLILTAIAIEMLIGGLRKALAPVAAS
jgi:MarC family membrane protein